jgi:EAL domain-containing protein (putative c-di-GMP-specific phosphodiesterase class I)
MDDFGTGYSSLSYLQKFPFDKIKIDRCFIADSSADSEAIFKAVAGLGTSLGMAITAEGVETTEQLERIRSERCTHVQGYLTGRPMAADKVAAFLTSRL